MPEQCCHEDSFAIEFAKNLFSLECLVTKQPFFCTEEKFIAAILVCWDLVREYRAGSEPILDVRFISILHKTLASHIGAPDAGRFIDDGGINVSWSCFVEDLDVDRTIDEWGYCEDAWVISQLFWGGHLPNLQLTVSWLCINALRLRYRYHRPIYPPKHLQEKFIEYLEASGPDCWDAESLRALMASLNLSVTH